MHPQSLPSSSPSSSSSSISSPCSLPLHHNHSHLQNLPKILHAIQSLLTPDNQTRLHSQQILKEQQQINFNQFLHQLFQLIAFTHQERDRYLCLLYLRSVIGGYGRPMGDFVGGFEQLHGGCGGYRGIVVDCMTLYLNKPHHVKYKKHYIDGLITKLYQTISTKNIDKDLLTLATDILGHSSQTRKSGLNFSTKNQQLIHRILTNPQLHLQPQLQSTKIEPALWTKFILALCNYTGFAPAGRFVYENLVSCEVGYREVVVLAELWSKMRGRTREVEELGRVLDVQGARMRDQGFRDWMEEIGDDGQAFCTMVKSIETTITDMLALMHPDQSQHHKPIPPTFLDSLLSLQTSLLSLPALTPPEQSSIISIISSTLHWLQKLSSLGIGIGIVCMPQYYVYKLCALLMAEEGKGRGRVYLVMGGLRPGVMKFWEYQRVIGDGVDCFVDGDWSNWEAFLAMVIHYIRNSDTRLADTQLDSHIAKLIKHCLSLPPSANPPTLLKPLIFSLICHYQLHLHKTQPKQPQGDFLQQLSIKGTLQIGYQLLTELLNGQRTGTGVGVEEPLEIVLEGLRDLSLGIEVYIDVFQEEVLRYLGGCLGGQFGGWGFGVCMELLTIVGTYLRIKYVDDRFLNILCTCLSSNNEGLQYRSCQLILTSLIIINLAVHTTQITPEQAKPLVSLLLGSPLLPYIQINLSQQNDDILFSKLLIELLLHEQAYPPVRDMLATVVASLKGSASFIYYFDRVWEAMVILYGEKGGYVEAKGIGKRVEELKMGRVEAMMEAMCIEDQECMQEEQNKNNTKNNLIKWSNLPDVRRVIDPSSIAGEYINSKLTSNLL